MKWWRNLWWKFEHVTLHNLLQREKVLIKKERKLRRKLVKQNAEVQGLSSDARRAVPEAEPEAGQA